MEWKNNHVTIEPPRKTKKLTGTRFAAIFGKNRWSTPFQIWCEVTKTWEKPFVSTKYTEAGKVIEPKQADYMVRSFFMQNLVRPSNIWGEDYFKKTWGDFFPDDAVLGGMWDYLLQDNNGKATAVLEMKTSQRSEDWQNDIPEYYALQAALYAYLLGVDQVYMVASFLEDADYEHPEDFEPDSRNTIVIPFKLSERYPDFRKRYVIPAYEWWENHVKTGISPDFDEAKDAEVLRDLRKKVIDLNTCDKEELLKRAEELKAELDANDAKIAEIEKQYKIVTDALRQDCLASMESGIKNVEIKGSQYTWTLKKISGGTAYDTEAMKADGVYEKYAKQKQPTYQLRAVKNEKEI